MPRKYVWGFNTLQLCKDMIIPWPTTGARRIVLSLRQDMKRTGKEYHWENRPSGLYVMRVK